MKFRVGDKVRIRKDSKYYVAGRSNPKDTAGIIEEIGPCRNWQSHMITVKWPDEWSNNYRVYDLELDEEVLYEI